MTASKRTTMIALAWLLAGHLAAACALEKADPLAETPDKIAFFENKIRPLLQTHCIDCHGEKKQGGGLRLDSRSAVLKGGESGPAIVPGKPEASQLVLAIRYSDKELRMPPEKALKSEDVASVVEWVRQGAIDPRKPVIGAVATAKDADWEAVYQKRLDWWSLKPLCRVDAPPEGVPGRDPIDLFIKLGLDGAKLRPAPPADAEVLLRRLAFVLTGLPPNAALRERYATDVRRDGAKAFSESGRRIASLPALRGAFRQALDGRGPLHRHLRLRVGQPRQGLP